MRRPSTYKTQSSWQVRNGLVYPPFSGYSTCHCGIHLRLLFLPLSCSIMFKVQTIFAPYVFRSKTYFHRLCPHRSSPVRSRMVLGHLQQENSRAASLLPPTVALGKWPSMINTLSASVAPIPCKSHYRMEFPSLFYCQGMHTTKTHLSSLSTASSSFLAAMQSHSGGGLSILVDYHADHA